MEYPDWLNGLIIALATIALVFVTIYYASVTKKILKESEQMRKESEQTRLDAQKPRIAVYIGFEKEQRWEGSRAPKIPTMYMYVENIGLGPAYDVEFDTEPDLIILENRSLRQIAFIANGILYLAPRQKRKIVIGHRDVQREEMDQLFQENLEIKVTYNGIWHKGCKECFCINFGEYESEYKQMVSELL